MARAPTVPTSAASARLRRGLRYSARPIGLACGCGSVVIVRTLRAGPWAAPGRMLAGTGGRFGVCRLDRRPLTEASRSAFQPGRLHDRSFNGSEKANCFELLILII